MAFRDLQTDVVIKGDNLNTYTAGSAVKAGQVVKLTGDYSVEPSNADGEEVEGVAAYDAAAGDTVAVAEDGCEVLLTSGTGTVSAGDQLASYGGTGNPGEVYTATDGTVDFVNETLSKGDYVLGEAQEADAGTNDDVRAKLDLQGYRPASG